MKIPHLPPGHSFVSLSAVPIKQGVAFYALDRTGGIWHLPVDGARWEHVTEQPTGNRVTPKCEMEGCENPPTFVGNSRSAYCRKHLVPLSK